MSSNQLCKACSLLEGLERGVPQAAIVRVLRCICTYDAEVSYRQIGLGRSWREKQSLQGTSAPSHIFNDLIRRRPPQ